MRRYGKTKRTFSEEEVNQVNKQFSKKPARSRPKKRGKKRKSERPIMIFYPLTGENVDPTNPDWRSKYAPKSYRYVTTPGAEGIQVKVSHKITNMEGMFANSNINNADLSSWDVSHVTNMNGMFENAVEFNQNISTWNVANVGRMNSMFNGATSFSQDLSLWKVSDLDKPKRFSTGSSIAAEPKFGAINGVWYYPLPYSTDPTAQTWRDNHAPAGYTFTANVGISSPEPITNMKDMFNNVSINVFDHVKNWKTGYVTTMEACFYNLTDFGTLSLIPNPDANNVIIEQSTTAGDAFYTSKYNELNGLDGDWVIIAGPNDGTDDADLPVTLPFDVIFGEITYTSGSTIYVNSNSALWFNGQNANYSYDSYEDKKTATSTLGLDRIMLGWGDYSINTVETRVSGAAPNRVYTIRAKLSQNYNAGDESPVVEPNFWWVAMYESQPGIFDIVIEDYDLTGQMADDDLWGFANSNSPVTLTFNDPTNVNSGSGGLSQGATRIQFADADNIPASDEYMTMNWNTSNVTNMSRMFFGNEFFKGKVGSWDTSSVENFSEMFSRANLYDEDLSNWDTSSATLMTEMFRTTTSNAFRGVGVGNWDVSNVTDMSGMFAYANVAQLDLTGWNPASVVNAQAMFQSTTYNGAGMNTVTWPELRNADQMFSNVFTLTNDGEPINWSMPKVLIGSRFFFGSLFNIQLGTFDMGSYWIDNQIPQEDKDTYLSETIIGQGKDKLDFYGMFFVMRNWNNGQDEGESTAPFELPFLRIGGAGTANEGLRVDVSDMFRQCNRLGNFFNTPITGTTFLDMSLSGFLQECTVFNNPLVSNLNVSGVNDLRAMFFDSPLFNQDLDTWDVSNVKTFSFMFGKADIAPQYTAASTVSYQMAFNGNITTWDIGSARAEADIAMDSMFKNNTAFNRDISAWDVSKVIDFDSMFQGAKLFNQPIGIWNIAGIDSTEALDRMFYTPGPFVDRDDNTYTYDMTFNQALTNWGPLPEGVPVNFNNNDSIAAENLPIFTPRKQPLYQIDNPNAFNNEQDDYFGNKIVMNDNYIVVGVNNEDPPVGATTSGTTAGAVYVFATATGNLLHTITSPNPVVGGNFGYDIGINSSKFVVGAYGEGTADSGNAYVYDLSTGNLLHTLNNPNAYDTVNNDQFGSTIDMSDNYIIVGARYEDEAGAFGSGKAYIFDAFTYALLHTLDNPDSSSPAGNDIFGSSVAISNSYAAVAASSNDFGGTSSGTVYVFSPTTGNLLYTLENPNSYANADYDSFGIGLVVNEEYLAVSTPFEDDDLSNSGVAYVYDVTTGSLLHTLVNPNDVSTTQGDYFGERYSIGISDTSLIVGAQNEDTLVPATAFQTGKAYIFDLASGELLNTIDPPMLTQSAKFGGGAGISNSYAAIGSPQRILGNTASGTVHTYSLT